METVDSTLNYEERVEKYKPIQNEISNSDSFDNTLFETFGEELELVRNSKFSKVWTLVGETDSFIISGYHFVNRIGYFITEVPFTEGENITVEL
ncbi:MAG TPA: hypothetical protein PKD00_00790 [Burkholderiales bacterium]|nr:hypothetical protein [Burkholderiales bacterium]